MAAQPLTLTKTESKSVKTTKIEIITVTNSTAEIITIYHSKTEKIELFQERNVPEKPSVQENNMKMRSQDSSNSEQKRQVGLFTLFFRY